MGCDESGEAADMGDGGPCCGAFDGFFPVLGETAAPAEPCEGAFDDPSAREDLEAVGLVGALDDLDRPASRSYRNRRTARS